MAHDERRPAAASGAIPAVNIAAADPASVYAQQHLIRAGDGCRKIGEIKLRRSGEDERFHGGAGRGDYRDELGWVNLAELGALGARADLKN